MNRVTRLIHLDEIGSGSHQRLHLRIDDVRHRVRNIHAVTVDRPRLDAPRQRVRPGNRHLDRACGAGADVVVFLHQAQPTGSAHPVNRLVALALVMPDHTHLALRGQFAQPR